MGFGEWVLWLESKDVVDEEEKVRKMEEGGGILERWRREMEWKELKRRGFIVA
jgi:hypothetical protein